MKTLLTITALLFSLTSFGQTFDDTLKMFDWGVRGIGIKSQEIAKIKSSGQDTLEITYPALIKNKHLFKYIKVGDKIFKEVDSPKKWYASPDGWYQYPSGKLLPITSADTSIMITSSPRFMYSDKNNFNKKQ